MPEHSHAGNSYKRGMTRKVFEDLLYRADRLLLKYPPPQALQAPRASWGTEAPQYSREVLRVKIMGCLWQRGGGKHIAEQQNETVAHRGQQPSSAGPTQGKIHFSPLLFLSEPQLAGSGGRETTQGLLREQSFPRDGRYRLSVGWAKAGFLSRQRVPSDGESRRETEPCRSPRPKPRATWWPM